MATILLTAVGSAVAGPIGGAIGALLGQQVDSRLLAPKPRHGPRLGDLAVQTSSYGTPIPRIFGTMRVAGTVIWATDLREERSTSGGGKGRPKSVSYSYSASFAVALSARPIRGVGRIWADGKLLRGAAGDFKTATAWRLHLGGEDQPPDPLIASLEGIGDTPAYRGIAYVMFEDLQLADFGNRIPSLTFEVQADPAPPTIGSVAEELSGGAIRAGPTPALVGYAASGDSVRSAIEAFTETVPMSLADAGGVLQLAIRSEEPVPLLPVARTGAAAEGPPVRTEVARGAAGGVPAAVGIAYYDPARDYQTGLQRASRGDSGARTEQVALPAAASAEAVKSLAELRLAALWAARARAKVALAWRDAQLRPGREVRIEGLAGGWRIARWTLERMAVALELVGTTAVGEGAAPAAPGRPVTQADVAHGPTRLVLLDLPLSEGAPSTRPVLLVAAAGAGAGWRSAELLSSLDGGASWQSAGRTAPAAVMGTAKSALGAAGSALLDLANQVEVELLAEDMWLEGRSDAALAGGANLAALGDELLQFGAAEPLGGRRFRLSRLLRGRRGSEWAAGGHAAGEPFVLLTQETLAPLGLAPAAAGSELRLLPAGLGDGGAGEVRRIVTGEALRPPAPAHLHARRGPDGAIDIGWVRRSRSGWDWTSAADTPLGEEREAYRLTLSGAGFERIAELTAPSYRYGPDEQATDGLSGPLTIRVEQQGTAAASRPAELSLP